MIHYHGCPITPRPVLLSLAGRSFCNSFAHPTQTATCHEIGQTNMLDNGAFTFWTKAKMPDWVKWATWAEQWLAYRTTWAVLPDVIDGGADANDRLVREWAPVLGEQGAPVWHLDEPIARLVRLCEQFGRVCFGSAGAYRSLRTPAWNRRMDEAFNAIADADGRVRVWVHMLRGMALAGSHYPFSSVDSTDIARNHHLPHKNAVEMANRWDSLNCPAVWNRVPDQLELTA